MLFGFGKKEGEKQALFKTSLTDKEDLEEIKKIASRLEQDEEVLLVAKQSRMKPGGSVTATPKLFSLLIEESLFGTQRCLACVKTSMIFHMTRSLA
jgi:hypothetical protein